MILRNNLFAEEKGDFPWQARSHSVRNSHQRFEKWWYLIEGDCMADTSKSSSYEQQAEEFIAGLELYKAIEDAQKRQIMVNL